MSALKNMLALPVSPRNRHQADSTTTGVTNTNTDTTSGGGGEGTKWNPDICCWQAAVGVVGTAALCVAVWYMVGRGGSSGRGEEEQKRKQMAKVEVRAVVVAVVVVVVVVVAVNNINQELDVLEDTTSSTAQQEEAGRRIHE